MSQIRRVTIEFGESPNCKASEVVVTNYQNLVLTCLDEQRRIYTVEGPLELDRCITFEVTCPDCPDEPMQTFTRCLCEQDGDCTGCEHCLDGLCAPACDTDSFCSEYDPRTGTLGCVECDKHNPCPDGEVCDSDKRCACPEDRPLRRSSDGRCVECEFEGIENCAECSAAGELLPLDCPRECDTVDSTCVECTEDAHCTGFNESCVLRSCVCSPGFVRNRDGNCVPAPECDHTNPAPSCMSCRDGVAVPLPCPSGKVCLTGHGCVPDCHLLGGCPKGYGCYTEERPDGSFVSGCLPCGSTCLDGQHCGEACGCVEDSSTCIPCSQIDNASDCAATPECLYSGGRCRGSQDYCSDELTVAYAAGAFTATLERPGDVLNILPIHVVGYLRRRLPRDGKQPLEVLLELRRGSFTLADARGPILDGTEFSQEKVVGGSFTLRALVAYREYRHRPSTGAVLSQHQYTEEVYSRALSATNGRMSVNNLSLPDLTDEAYEVMETDVLGRTVRSRRSHRVYLELQANTAVTLASGEQYAVPSLPSLHFAINNPGDYYEISDTQLLPDLGGSTLLPAADSPQPPGVRMFWHSASTGKLLGRSYALRNAGNTGWEASLESGFSYCDRVTVSCPQQSCAAVGIPARMLECLTPTLGFRTEKCNQELILTGPFQYPDWNDEAIYFVEWGEARRTFQASKFPFGSRLKSTVPTNEVVVGQLCAGVEVCRAILPVASSVPEGGPTAPTVITDCNDSGSEITLRLEEDAEAECTVSHYEIAGKTQTPEQSTVLAPGDYLLRVHWSCGCEVTEITVEASCCDTPVGSVTRTCTSREVDCTPPPAEAGVSYRVAVGPEAGKELGTDLCGYVRGLPLFSSARILATRAGCDDQTIVVPGMDYCCAGYGFDAARDGADPTRATMRGSFIAGTVEDISVTITPRTASEKITYDHTKSGPGRHSFDITGLDPATEYTLMYHTEQCGVLNQQLPATELADDCDHGLQLSPLTATSLLASLTTTKGCPCEGGAISTQVVEVTRLDESKELRVVVQSNRPSGGELVEGKLLLTDVLSGRTAAAPKTGRELFSGTTTELVFPYVKVAKATQPLRLDYRMRDDDSPNGERTLEVYYRTSASPFGDDLLRYVEIAGQRLTAADFRTPTRSTPYPNDSSLAFSDYRVATITIVLNCSLGRTTLEVLGMSDTYGKARFFTSIIMASCRGGLGYDPTGQFSGSLDVSSDSTPEQLEVSLSYSALTGVNGCTFRPITQRFFVLMSDLSVTPGSGILPAQLLPDKGSSAHPRVQWYEAGALRATQYPASGRATLTGTKSGTPYRVTVDCGCEQGKTITPG